MNRGDAKVLAIQKRIAKFQEAILKAQEYLESGRHATWVGFRPLFTIKCRDGSPLPPHRDWIRNVFLPRAQGALQRSEKLLEALERKSSEKSRNRN